MDPDIIGKGSKIANLLRPCIHPDAHDQSHVASLLKSTKRELSQRKTRLPKTLNQRQSRQQEEVIAAIPEFLGKGSRRRVQGLGFFS